MQPRNALAAAVLFVAFLPRFLGAHAPFPFDDLYHLKRIGWSAAHWPRVLAFDPDRGLHGAWCPWPPLYDAALGGVARLLGMASVAWVAPVAVSLFAAALAWVVASWRGLVAGAVAGLIVALQPYLLDVSSGGSLDHHWAEPIFVTLIAAAVLAPRRARLAGVALGVAIAAALFVQTALLVAAALAFAALFFITDDACRGAIAFALPAIAIALYRLLQPAGYPSNPWFLGWLHVAVLAAAAVAFLARLLRAKRIVALAAGALCLAPLLPSLAAGAHFFGGDPWLSSIDEFQPMFRDPATFGTELANLTGGALLAFFLWHRQRVVALFAIAYAVLSITSHRFLVPGVGMFAVAAALAVAKEDEGASGGRARPGALKRRTRWIARTTAAASGVWRPAAGGLLAIALLPTISYAIYAATQPRPAEDDARVVAQAVAKLPPGRVLAPWSLGHAIDVVGRHPVVLDNFGSMPGAPLFDDASRALLATSEAQLVRWCRAHGVRYVVFAGTRRIATTAATIDAGVEPRATVWGRMLRGRRFLIVEIR